MEKFDALKGRHFFCSLGTLIGGIPRCSTYGIFTYIDFPKLPFFLVNGPVSFSEWTWGMFLCCYNFFVQVAIQRESSSTSKLWFPIGISFSRGLFSGAMLVLGRVSLHPGRLRGLEDDVPFSQFNWVIFWVPCQFSGVYSNYQKSQLTNRDGILCPVFV